MIEWAGRVWRHVPAGGHPLNFGYVVRARGRWNRAGVYGCLYTSLTFEGAVAEHRKLCDRATGGVPTMPREVVSIDVHRLHPVLDLTQPESLAEFGLDSVDHILADTEASLELCRTISDEARRRGAVGLLAPSTALEGAVNLMIYHDGFAAGIDVNVGPDRVSVD